MILTPYTLNSQILNTSTFTLKPFKSLSLRILSQNPGHVEDEALRTTSPTLPAPELEQAETETGADEQIVANEPEA